MCGGERVGDPELAGGTIARMIFATPEAVVPSDPADLVGTAKPASR